MQKKYSKKKNESTSSEPLSSATYKQSAYDLYYYHYHYHYHLLSITITISFGLVSYFKLGVHANVVN